MPKASSYKIAESLVTLLRSELTDEDVRTAIKNSGGVRGSLLIPDAPFELLVRRAISRLLTPALQCKEFVHAELLRIAAQCAPADITRFPKLQARALPSLLTFPQMAKDPVTLHCTSAVAGRTAFPSPSSGEKHFGRLPRKPLQMCKLCHFPHVGSPWQSLGAAIL